MANPLAYYDTATNTAVKSFIVQAAGMSFFLGGWNRMICRIEGWRLEAGGLLPDLETGNGTVHLCLILSCD
jgi:hypothetical protein